MITQQKHKLSERQIAILTFIHEYQTIHGFVPTIREIAEAIGTSSTSTVSYQINRLVRLGYISKVSEVSRGMILLVPAYEAVGTEAPEDTNLSMMRAELLALRVENQRIRQLYEERVKKLERERNQLSQTLSTLKYRAIKRLEGILGVATLRFELMQPHPAQVLRVQHEGAKTDSAVDVSAACESVENHPNHH